MHRNVLAMTDAIEPAIPTEPPRAGSELDTLTGSLERIRRTFAWKCADLDAAAMGTRIGASAMTLGGLVRHLTQVESDLFAFRMSDQRPVGLTEDLGWTWTGHEDVAGLWRDWYAAVARSRELLAAAIADGGLGATNGHEFPGWGAASVRRLLVDMIEEYARHTGHADLIREVVDGRVGEDPPSSDDGQNREG